MDDTDLKYLLDNDGALHVRTELVFTSETVKQALEWGRLKKYTYERDGEIGDLMLVYISNVKYVPFDIEDTDTEVEL